DNVSFRYPHTGILAIHDFNLHVKPGEKVAIVGKTGSGKSTLAQLILRMYDIDSGSLSLDGKSIRQIPLNDLRSQISYVPQDVFLFSDTIRNNIKFSDMAISDEAMIAAAKQAVIYDEIMRLEHQFDTAVGERGVTLSGGQKQRISIARALVKQPALVIFDDCLSAVDVRTEKEIISNMYTYVRDKTAIIITHRIFSLFNFDKIIVMHEGKIAEMGTHDSLLKKKGLYAEMYYKQQEQERRPEI